MGFRRWLRERTSKISFADQLRSAGVDFLAKEDIQKGSATYQKVFVTLTIGKLRHFGISASKLEKIGKWLSSDGILEYVLTRVVSGMNLFLYTDLNETMALHSDIELVDWLRIGHNFSEAYFLLSINAIIYEIEDRLLKIGSQEPISHDLAVWIGSSQIHETKSGRVVVSRIPLNTESIVLVKPFGNRTEFPLSNEEYVQRVRFSEPGEIIHVG